MILKYNAPIVYPVSTYGIGNNGSQNLFRTALSNYYDGFNPYTDRLIDVFYIDREKKHRLDEPGYACVMSINFANAISNAAFALEAAINEIIAYLYSMRKNIKKELLEILEDGSKKFDTIVKIKKLCRIFGFKANSYYYRLNLLFKARGDLTAHYKPIDFKDTKIAPYKGFLEKEGLLIKPYSSNSLIAEVSNNKMLTWLYACSNNRFARWVLVLVKDFLFFLERKLKQVRNKSWRWSDVLIYGDRIFCNRSDRYEPSDKYRKVFITLEHDLTLLDRRRALASAPFGHKYHILAIDKNEEKSVKNKTNAYISYNYPSFNQCGLILHNEDGPAVEVTDFSTGKKIKEYWLFGKRHTRRDFYRCRKNPWREVRKRYFEKALTS